MIWHSNLIADVLQELRVDPDVGLTEQEATERLKEYGKNSIDEQSPLSFRKALTKQLASPFTALLLVASGLTLVLDLYKQILLQVDTEWVLPVVVAAITAVAAFFGAIRHCHAHALMAKIHTLSSPETQVLRDGKVQDCATHALVPGDIVLLTVGDIVPADCRLIEACRLKCDECDLTEATMPTDKYADTVFDDITPLAQRTNMVYAGTVITAGTATAVVVATGNRSEMGHSAAEGQQSATELPAQKQAKTLQVWWSIAVAVFGIIALIFGLARHDDHIAVILTVTALLMAALPRNLPDLWLQLTARGIRRMTRHRVRLSRPEAIDTLGRVSIICTEQETLFSDTSARLCRAFVGHRAVNLTNGAVQAPGLSQLIRLAALNTDNSAEDASILTYLSELGIKKEDLLVDMPRIGELAPTAERKIGVHLAGEQTLILVSGEWRALLPLCIKGNVEELTAAATAMEADGLQVTAVTYRLSDTAPAVYTDDALACDLTCAGLLGWKTPMRDRIRETAGTVRTILFSDESVSAAKAAAQQAGLTDRPQAVTANEVKDFTESDWDAAAIEYNVYCGLTAQQKEQLIATLQRQGETVAVTACRSEDATLLKAADAGFARGTAATDVAKAAADVLLSDDNYASMVQTVVEARWLHREKVGAFALLSACSAVILGIGFGALMGLTSLAYGAVLLTGLHLILLALPTCPWVTIGIFRLIRKWLEKN
ncbi:MAG: hypothetical protein IJN04_05585 [Clostridia bacterium]|nr:hypothetical protein [Clostridia bacterium]